MKHVFSRVSLVLWLCLFANETRFGIWQTMAQDFSGSPASWVICSGLFAFSCGVLNFRPERAVSCSDVQVWHLNGLDLSSVKRAIDDGEDHSM